MYQELLSAYTDFVTSYEEVEEPYKELVGKTSNDSCKASSKNSSNDSHEVLSKRSTNESNEEEHVLLNATF